MGGCAGAARPGTPQPGGSGAAVPGMVSAGVSLVPLVRVPQSGGRAGAPRALFGFSGILLLSQCAAVCTVGARGQQMTNIGFVLCYARGQMGFALGACGQVLFALSAFGQIL